MEKILGKISRVSFGKGGYEDAQFGLSLTFDLKGSSVGTFLSGGWAIARDEGAQWTEGDRSHSQARLCSEMIKILDLAKVSDVSQLKGIPVEVTLEGMRLKEWRVLDEVI